MAAPRNPEITLQGRYSSHRYAVGLLLLAGALLFQFWGNATRGYIDTRSLFYWWGRQWFDPASDAEQGSLVILVSAVLFFQNWRRLSGTYPENPDKTGFGLLIAALILHAVGYATQQTRISIVACLVFVAGLCRLAGGQRAARAARFPLGFALLAIPVGFLQPAGFYLRLAVSDTVETCLRWVGHPVIRNGTQLFSIDGRYEYDVAAACSGVRSLVALIALGVLFGYLRLARWPARMALIALVLPFAFVGNLVRILAIVGAGQFWGLSAATRVHVWSGFLVFAVVLVLLGLAVRWLTRLEVKFSPKTPPSDQDATSATAPVSGPSIGWGGTLLILLLIVGVVELARALDRAPAVATAGVRLAADGINPIPLPEFLGTEWIGQRVEVTEAERTVLPPDTGYSRRNYVEIADRSHQVFVSVVLSGRDRSSIHRPELCLVGQGWTIDDRKETRLTLRDGQVLPVTLLRVRREQWSRDGQRQAVSSWLAYCFVGQDRVIPTHSEMLWRNALNRLEHLRGERWAYLIVQTFIDQDEATDRKRMEEVLSPVWESLRGS